MFTNLQSLKTKRAVMRRVYAIWLWRYCADSLWIKLGLFGALFGQLFIQISPLKVLENTTISDFPISYFFNSLLGTEATVQLSIIFGCL